MNNSAVIATSAVWYGVVVALCLVIVKFFVLFVTDSVSMRLNLADSCMDFIVSLANYWATVASFRSHSRYPYGYDKITALAAMTQILILVYFVYDSVCIALARISLDAALEPSFESVIALIISAALTVSLVRYQRMAIRETGHLVVYADSIHYTTDLITNFSMLAYFALLYCVDCSQYYFIGRFDAFLALFLSVYITICCLKVGVGAWHVLMDARLPRASEETLLTQIKTTYPEYNARVIASRFSGVRECFEVELQLPKQCLTEATRLIDRLHTQTNCDRRRVNIRIALA